MNSFFPPSVYIALSVQYLLAELHVDGCGVSPSRARPLVDSSQQLHTP